MCSKYSAKVLLAIFNFIFLLAGLSVAGVGVYTWFLKAEYVDLVGSSTLPAITQAMIGFGGFVTLVALAGCAGSLFENRVLLILYLVFVILIFVAETAIGVVGFIYTTKLREIFDAQAKERFLDNYGYPDFNSSNEVINILQLKLKCCGYNKPEDWAQAAYYLDVSKATERGDQKMPISCCKDMSVAGCNNDFDFEKIHSEGCVLRLESLFTHNLILVGGVCIAMAGLQFFGIVVSILLIEKTKENDRVFALDPSATPCPNC